VNGSADVGVTDEEADEAELSPTAFVAFTVNVYAVPLVKPATVQLVEVDEHVFVTPPTCGEADTV